MTDFSPWPRDGAWFRFERNYGIAASVTPDYGGWSVSDIESIKLKEGTHWFLSVRTPLFHFYIGAKPIDLNDPGFYWREYWLVQEYLSEGLRFFEPSARFGLGKVR